MTALRVAIAGCTGRTGRAVLRAAAGDPTVRITAALAAADDPALGRDAGLVAGIDELGVPIAASCEAPCQALIEFTLPAGCRTWAQWCGMHDVALVSGTTGLSELEHAALEQASQRVPVVWSPNMSVGANLLMELVEETARRLAADWDVEICETHHNRKIDAPSGTARRLYEIVCAARGVDPLGAATYGRYGQCGPRVLGEIGVHALRLGDNVGEHAVHFAAAGEMITLSHRAFSRESFAIGALHAARWVVQQPLGLYSMRDVLAYG